MLNRDNPRYKNIEQEDDETSTKKRVLMIGVVAVLVIFGSLFWQWIESSQISDPADIAFIRYSGIERGSQPGGISVMDVDLPTSRPFSVYRTSANWFVTPGGSYDFHNNIFVMDESSGRRSNRVSLYYPLDGTTRSLFTCVAQYCGRYLLNPEADGLAYVREADNGNDEIWYADFSGILREQKIADNGWTIAWTNENELIYSDHDTYEAILHNIIDGSETILGEFSFEYIFSVDSAYYAWINIFDSEYVLVVGETESNDEIWSLEYSSRGNNLEPVGWIADNTRFIYIENLNQSVNCNGCVGRVMELNMKTLETVELVSIEGEIDDVDIHPDENRFLITSRLDVRDNFITQAHMYDRKEDTLRLLDGVNNTARWLNYNMIE